MMRFLRFISLIAFLGLAACSNPYKHLAASTESRSALRFRPAFSKELYRCVVDGRILYFKKFHLSGLLLFKTFDDGSTRVVFQNEMGFSLFDFKWDDHDSFQVISIIPQLDKPTVINLLHKDMNLLLLKNLNSRSERFFTKGDEHYSRFDLEKGFAYYISERNKLERIENAGHSRVITITLGNKESDKGMPETVLFKHHKAHFTIDLKKIKQDAD